MKCPSCGAELSSVSFRSTCPSCGRELHSCKMCAFYSESSFHACRESVDEEVRYKEENNFCESFRLADKTAEGSVSNQKEKASRDALKALFGDL